MRILRELREVLRGTLRRADDVATSDPGRER
jgi:hypothetical protein